MGIFFKGNKLSWSTSARQSGTMIVTSVSDRNFTLEQTNVHNKKEGIIRFDGVLNEDGTLTIKNEKWKETWIGKLEGNIATGRVNKIFIFVINGAAQEIKSDSAKTETGPLVVGKKLSWRTSAGQNGTLTIVSIEDGKVAFDQVNFRNKAAGKVRMTAEIKSDGKFHLYNAKWKEKWVGTIYPSKVSGTINDKYTFTISE